MTCIAQGLGQRGNSSPHGSGVFGLTSRVDRKECSGKPSDNKDWKECTEKSFDNKDRKECIEKSFDIKIGRSTW